MNLGSMIRDYMPKSRMYAASVAAAGALAVGAFGCGSDAVTSPTAVPQPTQTQSIDDVVSSVPKKPERFQVASFSRDDKGFYIKFFLKQGVDLLQVIAEDDHGNTYKSQIIYEGYWGQVYEGRRVSAPQGFVYRGEQSIRVDMPGVAPLASLMVRDTGSAIFSREHFRPIRLEDGKPVLEKVVGTPLDWNSNLQDSIYPGESDKLSQFLEIRVGNPRTNPDGTVLYDVELENSDYQNVTAAFFTQSGPFIQTASGTLENISRSGIVSSEHYNNTFIAIPKLSTESVLIELPKGVNAGKGSLLIMQVRKQDEDWKYLILPFEPK